MTDLVAVVSSGPGTAKHVEKVITGLDWGKVFVIVPKGLAAPFPTGGKIEVVGVDFTQPIGQCVEEIVKALKGKLDGIEVGLNLISGDGKEHMAVLSAVLRCGVGFKLVALTKDGVSEI